MALMPMQYKGYVWPHNPRTYRISYERKLAVHKVPFGRYVMQDLGMTRRVMTGEGEFFGPGAYDEFKRLATVFYEEGPGTLVHPVWQSAQAYFAELSLAQEPRKDYVRYTFAFWEDFAGYAGKLERKVEVSGSESVGSAGGSLTVAPNGQRFHTVGQGETIYGIAKLYGTNLVWLKALNPQVKNPNDLTPGQILRVG